MKKLIKSIALSASLIPLAFSSATYAHPETPAPAPAPAPKAAPQAATEPAEMGAPALWKVADEDTTIYLFGTIHILPENVKWYNAKIATALQSSDELVTEIHIPKGGEAAIGMAFMEKATLPEGQSLRDLFTPQQRKDYEAAMAGLGVPPESFDKFKPWFAAMNLSMIPLIKAGYSPESGVEKVLEGKAEGMARGALESVEFQGGLFDNLPQEAQVKFLMTTISQMDQMVPNIGTMVDQWNSGDPEKLGELVNKGFDDPVLSEALLYSRNRHWAEWIHSRLNTPGTVFIAVGAGHLAGKESVQEALETHGIEATRIQ